MLTKAFSIRRQWATLSNAFEKSTIIVDPKIISVTHYNPLLNLCSLSKTKLLGSKWLVTFETMMCLNS